MVDFYKSQHIKSPLKNINIRFFKPYYKAFLDHIMDITPYLCLSATERDIWNVWNIPWACTCS